MNYSKILYILFLKPNINCLTIIFIILFFLCFNISFSQIKINKVSFKANINLPEEKLFDLLSIRKNDIIDTSAFTIKTDSIRKFLFQNGYAFTSLNYSFVSSYPYDYYHLIITPTDFSEILINNITILNDTNYYSNQLKSKLEGNIFNQNLLQNEINSLLNTFVNQGYPLTSISIDSLYLNDNSYNLNIVLRVEKGNPVLIDSIIVSGNNLTDEQVIIRNSGISKGMYFDKKIIDKIPQRLMKLDIFNSVIQPALFLDRDRGILSISVEESRASSFDVVLGYQPSSSQDEKGEITGLLNLGFKNLFGTARKLFVFWQKDTRKSQTIELKYVEPNLLNFPIKSEVQYYQREEDSLFVQRSIKLLNSLLLSDNLEASLSLSYQTTIPGSENSNSSFNRNKLYSLGFELLYDTRDNIKIPRSGAVFRNSFAFGTKYYSSNLLDFSNKIVRNIYLDIQWYNNFFKNQVLCNEFQGKIIITSNDDFTDLFYLGGINSIRGYRENQFMVSSAIWLNNEYRFLFSDNSSFYPFFDIGYYKKNKTIDGTPQIDDLIYSYGFGFNILSGIGIIRLNFALGKGDSFSGMKVHLGFKNNF